ncbi:hypothetical protein, partial [Methanosarcina sp. A14]
MTFLIKGLTANFFEKELIEKSSKTTWSALSQPFSKNCLPATLLKKGLTENFSNERIKHHNGCSTTLLK